MNSFFFLILFGLKMISAKEVTLFWLIKDILNILKKSTVKIIYAK